MTAASRGKMALRFLASLIVIGLGTIFAGKVAKGVVLLLLGNGATIGSVVMSVSLSKECKSLGLGTHLVCSAGYPAVTMAEATILVTLVATGLWIYGLLDAVASTRWWSRRHRRPG
jgi:hypothetical protein